MAGTKGSGGGGGGTPVELAATGISGLDSILGGGLPVNRLYLIQGEPGTGKTTLSMQFLQEGRRRGERGLYVTLSESKGELEAVAASHGWDLDGIELYEVAGDEQHLRPEQEYTAFHPSEVELGSTVQALLDRVDAVRPQRVVIDSLSEMRLLARDPLRYRRQILALKHFLLSRGATVMLVDDPAAKVGEHQFQTLAHGTIMLERVSPEFGHERRRLQIGKMRGVSFDGGYHDLMIRRGGVVVYPRLVAADGEPDAPLKLEPVASGIPELDKILGGGPDRGTATLLIGPAGTGKSSLCMQYVVAAAKRGENCAVFSFDERIETTYHRCEGLGIDLRGLVKAKKVSIEQIDPGVLSPGEFVARVQEAVERRDARVVVIDSLNGYLNAMAGERFLLIQMHELLTYLAQKGVLTLMIAAQTGLVGGGVEAPVDMSYLADTVLLMRYFEFAGRVRKALSVVKKRSGKHEDLIREVQMTSAGVRLGAPLTDFEGVLTGAPRYIGGTAPLFGNQQHGPGTTGAGNQ